MTNEKHAQCLLHGDLSDISKAPVRVCIRLAFCSLQPLPLPSPSFPPLPSPPPLFPFSSSTPPRYIVERLGGEKTWDSRKKKAPTKPTVQFPENREGRWRGKELIFLLQCIVWCCGSPERDRNATLGYLFLARCRTLTVKETSRARKKHTE